MFRVKFGMKSNPDLVNGSIPRTSLTLTLFFSPKSHAVNECVTDRLLWNILNNVLIKIRIVWSSVQVYCSRFPVLLYLAINRIRGSFSQL